MHVLFNTMVSFMEHLRQFMSARLPISPLKSCSWFPFRSTQLHLNGWKSFHLNIAVCNSVYIRSAAMEKNKPKMFSFYYYLKKILWLISVYGLIYHLKYWRQLHTRSRSTGRRCSIRPRRTLARSRRWAGGRSRGPSGSHACARGTGHLKTRVHVRLPVTLFHLTQHTPA